MIIDQYLQLTSMWHTALKLRTYKCCRPCLWLPSGCLQGRRRARRAESVVAGHAWTTRGNAVSGNSNVYTCMNVFTYFVIDSHHSVIDSHYWVIDSHYLVIDGS